MNPERSGSYVPGHPRLDALVARAAAAAGALPPRLGLVYPCDALALDAASRIAAAGLARPILIGPREAITRAAGEAGVELTRFEIVACDDDPAACAHAAAAMAREAAVDALMKGSLHTDTLMAAIVARSAQLRTPRRISHAFVFDLPRYPKLLALTDCVINIAPDLAAKRDILGNALALLHRLGIARPNVAIVAAVETVNPALQATLDAQALVAEARSGAWPGATVEGPFGFDNAFSAEAARTKGIASDVAGHADLMLMPDLNAGNMLYKAFVHVGGAECAGLVLGARLPVVLTSRADSAAARLASAALAVMAVLEAAAEPDARDAAGRPVTYRA